MLKRSPRFVLFVFIPILLAGFFLRIESMLETSVSKPLRADAGNYFMYAYNLRHKHTYSREIGNMKNLESPVTPDAVRSPGYPLFLAFFVDGLPDKNMIDKILIFQAIISSLTIILAFSLFRSFLSLFWAGGVSFFVALSPHLIAANSFVLTETLFCFLIVLFGWLISLFAKRPSFLLGMIIGGIIGIASLVRPSLQYFFIPMAFLLIFHYGWKKGHAFHLL